VAPAELRPTVEYPETPVLLECAGIAKTGRGHNRSEYLYIVWRFDAHSDEWRELGRAQSAACEWAADLAPIARRAIDEQIGAPDLTEVERRISVYLNSELGRVAERDRMQVLAVIHDAIATRIVTPRQDGAAAWVG
jgi:hypothetical protein